MNTTEFLSHVNAYGLDSAWDAFWASFNADHLLGVPESELEASYDRISALYDKIRGSRDTEVMAAKSLFRKAKLIGVHPIVKALERHGGVVYARRYLDGYHQRRLAAYYKGSKEECSPVADSPVASCLSPA